MWSRMKKPWNLWKANWQRKRKKENFFWPWREKKALRWITRRCWLMQISETAGIWLWCCKMTQRESDFSEVNLSIWKAIPTLQRKNSLRFTRRLPRPWQAREWLFVPWISGQTNRRITSSLRKKKIQPWDCGLSVSAWPDRRFSKPSCGLFSGQAHTADWLWCIPWLPL